MKEINLRDILTILRIRIVWLIIVPILAGGLMGAYQYFYLQNEYTSTAKLYVLLGYTDSTGIEKYEVSTSSSFAADFANLITTQEVLGETARQLGWQSLPGDTKIAVNSVSSTRVINISVTSHNAQNSMQIANTLSNVFVEYIQQMIEQNTVHIAASAQLPPSPSGPDRLKNTALATIAGLVGAAAAVVFLDMMNTTIRTEEQIEENLALPVLARVTDYREQMKQFSQHNRARIAIYQAVNDQTRENIKTLALNLRFASVDKTLKSILVTSSVQDEGKSSISVMLATNLALEGHSVLMVDLDHRSPSLGRYLGVRGQYDLSDCLRGSITLQDAIVQSPIPGVSLLDSRHKTALLSKMLQSETFRALYAAMCDSYEYIIFDISPVGMFVDAAEVANIVDGVLMVAGCGSVDTEVAKDSIEQLKRVNANILGVVLNNVDPAKSSRYRNYYYRRYGYYKTYGSAYGLKNANNSRYDKVIADEKQKQPAKNTRKAT